MKLRKINCTSFFGTPSKSKNTIFYYVKIIRFSKDKISLNEKKKKKKKRTKGFRFHEKKERKKERKKETVEEGTMSQKQKTITIINVGEITD